MNILFSTDNRYVMPMVVLMTSIGMNCKAKINYYLIIDESFDERNKEPINITASKFGCEVTYCVINKSLIKKIPFGNDEMPCGLSIATYYRLFLTELLPVEVNKILYLDVDMIVRHSLEKLWNIDITNYAIAAVPDMDESEHILSKRLPYPMESGYFNAGMLLINVDYWRQNNLFTKFFEFIFSNKDILNAHDQDTLNVFFYNKKLILPVTYNFQNGFIYMNATCYNAALQKQIIDCECNPAIVHYTCSKPWTIDCNNPMMYAWLYYKRHCCYADLCLYEYKSLKMRIWYWLYRNNFYFRGIDKLPFNKYKRVILYR